MQPMICCVGALKTDMLKSERRNNESKNKKKNTKTTIFI